MFLFIYVRMSRCNNPCRRRVVVVDLVGHASASHGPIQHFVWVVLISVKGEGTAFGRNKAVLIGHEHGSGVGLRV